MADTTKGASDDERLLYAARSDDEDLLLEIFEKGNFNINHQDGETPVRLIALGCCCVYGRRRDIFSALHYAASKGSTEVLEHILSHEDCDVDPVNYILKQTPLHLAVQLEDPKLRQYVVESLLDAGADMSIKDKTGSTALDYVAEADTEILKSFRRAQAVNAVSQEDIASDEDSEDSGDGSDED
ncbi:Ankyrin repeat-containing domain protein [Amanita muscaria]